MTYCTRGTKAPNAKEVKKETTKSENDVLYGRGGQVNAHPGNISYKKKVKEYKIRYNFGTPAKKKKIINVIINHIKSKGGHFLKQTEESKPFWVVVPFDEAKKKVSQALRENAPALRRLFPQYKAPIQVTADIVKNSISASGRGSVEHRTEESSPVAISLNEFSRQQRSIPKLILASSDLSAEADPFDVKRAHSDNFTSAEATFTTTDDVETGWSTPYISKDQAYTPAMFIASNHTSDAAAALDYEHQTFIAETSLDNDFQKTDPGLSQNTSEPNLVSPVSVAVDNYSDGTIGVDSHFQDGLCKVHPLHHLEDKIDPLFFLDKISHDDGLCLLPLMSREFASTDDSPDKKLPRNISDSNNLHPRIGEGESTFNHWDTM